MYIELQILPLYAYSAHTFQYPLAPIEVLYPANYRLAGESFPTTGFCCEVNLLSDARVSLGLSTAG